MFYDIFRPEPSVLGRLYDGVRSRSEGNRVVAMGYETSAARSKEQTPLAYSTVTAVFHRRGHREFAYRRGGWAGHCQAKDGQLSLLPAGFTLDVRYHERCEGLVVGFSNELVAEVGSEVGYHGEFPLAAGIYDPALSAISEAFWDSGSGSASFFDALGRAMLVKIFESQPSRAVQGGELTPGWLRAAIALVRKASDRPIALQEMAEAAGLSRAHFARSFKKATGYSPLAYVARTRVERARELILGDSEASLASVAAAVGFCDQSHLTHHFRQAFGTTPAAFRRGLGHGAPKDQHAGPRPSRPLVLE